MWILKSTTLVFHVVYLHFFFFAFLQTGLRGVHVDDVHLRLRAENVALTGLGVLQWSGDLGISQLSIDRGSTVGLWLVAWEWKRY